MTSPPRDERFFRAALRSMAPLLVWAAHFAWCYLVVAFGCVAWGPQAPLRALVIGASVVALAAITTQAVRAWRRRGTPLAVPAERWSSVLALLGVGWTTLPAAVLPLCRID
jgi:hypothetical protein